MNPMKAVREFHEAFGHPVAETVAVPETQLRKLRERLIEEEYYEVWSASLSEDPVELAKELADLIYVIAGAALVWGIPLDEVFEAVHESNMSKLGPDGKPIYREDGKVIKPEGWQPPDIASILKEHGFEGDGLFS